MPEPIDHTKQRGAIETLLRHVPGFRGYLEKEYRRESDELQRVWLADRLDRAKRGLDALTRSLADRAQLDALPLAGRLRANLDKIIGRIRGAMQGYSGFFDLVKVDQAVLDRVYQHDVGLMDQVEDAAEALEGLGRETSRPAEALERALALVQDLDRAWDLRVDMLRGLE